MDPILFKFIRKAGGKFKKDFCFATYSAEFKDDVDAWIREKLPLVKAENPGSTIIVRAYTDYGEAGNHYTDTEL